MINLTTKFPFNKNSGCYLAPNEWTETPKKLQTISIPTIATRKTTKPSTTTTVMPTITTEVPTIAATTEIPVTTTEFFNETTTTVTEDLNMQFEEIFENLEDLTFEDNVNNLKTISSINKTIFSIGNHPDNYRESSPN